MSMSQKSSKSLVSTSRLYSYVHGGLNRIAKRRYTRDLFDDIIDCAQTNTENIQVSEEEKLLTLFRCFNNFFNKKFDSERLFKALAYSMSKERAKLMMTWLRQKKADNIYVIGRFILHISSYLEDQNEVQPNQIKECGNFFNLIFFDSPGILDENLILIFSFLSRKGYFRSIVGFILKHFKTNVINLKNVEIHEKSKSKDLVSFETWIMYLTFPLIFAVKWRIKVEEFLKAEAERTELYGSNNSIDDDYANASIMNMSIMSVSSEYSSEDPHSRQTRIFLKRLLSSWCNSVYFNDVFYQYFVSNLSIRLANRVLSNAVPIYLIILALVEPAKQRRKFSIDSTLSNNKTLLVMYKLNANSSLGLLNLLVCEICVSEQYQNWHNVGQEEAYGIIVCLHLAILALFDQFSSKENIDKNKSSLCTIHEFKEITIINENLKSVLQEIKDGISQCINQVIRIALSGLIDPDVVLPLAYFYQNLKTDLKVSEQTLLSYKMILSKKVPFIRYLWSLCLQSVASRDIYHLSSSSERRISESFDKSIIFKSICDGRMVSIDDMHRFLSILSTMLECVTFHLNTLYQAETRRKSSSSYGPSPAAVCSNFLLWPELWNMTSELAALSIGLIKIAVSLVNLKETDISEIHCQCNMNMKSSLSYQEMIIAKIHSVLRLIRIFCIHIDKLNSDNLSITDVVVDIDPKKLSRLSSKQQIQSIFDDGKFSSNLKDDRVTGIHDTIVHLFYLKYVPGISNRECKLEIVKNLLTQLKADHATVLENEQQVIDINYEKQSFFQEVFHQIFNNTNLNFLQPITISVNKQPIQTDQFINQLLHEGLDPVNHLFSCDGNQLLYPNPYVENFQGDYRKYYELLGKLFAVNIFNENKLKKKFSPFFLEKFLFANDTVYNINDLNTVDTEVAKNLLLLSKTDDELDCFNFKFVLTQNTFGKLHTYEIVKDGENIPVTKENKNEYIHGVVEFLLDKQIKPQCDSFRQGFDSVFPADIFTMLSTKDIRYLISNI